MHVKKKKSVHCSCPFQSPPTFKKTNPVLSIAQSYADERLQKLGLQSHILILVDYKAETKLLVIFIKQSHKTQVKNKMCKTKSQNEAGGRSLYSVVDHCR